MYSRKSKCRIEESERTPEKLCVGGQNEVTEIMFPKTEGYVYRPKSSSKCPKHQHFFFKTTHIMKFHRTGREKMERLIRTKWVS